MEKKYYRITVKNMGEKTDDVKDVIYVFAEEVNGNYQEAITGINLYCPDADYFSTRKFMEKNAGLVGIEKIELSRKQFNMILETMSDEMKTDYTKDVLYVQKETLKKVEEMYNQLLDSENKFKESFRK